MGPIQQGVNQTIRSLGVEAGAVKAGKVADKMISEANDAAKNEMAGQKAKLNAERLKNLKLINKKLRAEIRALKKEPGGSK